MKNIEISGCNMCVYAKYHRENKVMYCDSDSMNRFTISKYYREAETTHPDCLLDDVEEQGGVSEENILKLLGEYRTHNTIDAPEPDGEGMELVDLLTPDGDDIDSGKDELRRIARHLYDYLPRQEEQGGWISVEDRLPKVNKLVLIYSTIRAVDIASLGRFGKSWWVNTGKSFQYNEYEKVTHWQPLPDKPKEGK
jgi:hypothetical protein